MFKQLIKPKSLIIYILALIIIFLCRLKSFNNNYLNVDETVWIYLSKLNNGNIPYVHFDPQTSGISPIYLLKFINLFTDLNIKSYRIIYVILTATTLVITIWRFSNKKYLPSIILSLLQLILIFNIQDQNFISIDNEYLMIILINVLILILHLKKINTVTIYLYSLIILLLFFTKFQSLFFVILFSILLPLKFLLENQREYFRIIILSYFANVIILICNLYYFDILDNFYYGYIARNLEYGSLYKQDYSWFLIIKDFIVISLRKFYLSILLIILTAWFGFNKNLNFKKIISVLFILFITLLIKFQISFIKIDNSILNKFLNLSMIVCILYCCIIITKNIKKINFKNFKAIFHLSLLITSVFTIIITKYNFIHYFLLLIPIIMQLIIITNNRINSNKNTFFLFLFTTMTFFIQYNDNKLDNSKNEKFIKYEDKRLYKNNRILKKYIKPKERLIFLGFIKSTPHYTAFYNRNKFTSRLANTQFLTDFRIKGEKNHCFIIEDEHLLQDLIKYKPKYIIDFENVLNKIESSKSLIYILTNYKISAHFKEFDILTKNK